MRRTRGCKSGRSVVKRVFLWGRKNNVFFQTGRKTKKDFVKRPTNDLNVSPFSYVCSYSSHMHCGTYPVSSVSLRYVRFLVGPIAVRIIKLLLYTCGLARFLSFQTDRFARLLEGIPGYARSHVSVYNIYTLNHYS